jgi:chitodextrinase
LTGLTANTQYQVYIRARDNAGNLSNPSTTVTFTTGQVNDTTPPSTPGTPTASAVTATTATLNWGASTDTGGSGLAGYNVYREQGATDPILATPTTNTVGLTGLTANTQYQVYIRARDNAGNLSAASALATFTTPQGGTGTCSATPTVQSQWQDGYVMQPVTVRNTGTTAITGWQVVFTLPTGHAVTGLWEGIRTVNGQTVTVRNADYNGSISPGQSRSFGFQASRPNGNTALPTTFTCTVV